MGDQKKLINTINNMVYSVIESFEPVITVAKQVNKIWEEQRRFLKSLDFDFETFEKGMERISRGIIETEEDLKTFKIAIIDLGYPPDEEMDISTMRAIAQSYQEDKDSLKEIIDEFMCDYYDDSSIRRMGQEWECNQLVRKRLPILRNVIMSHNLGMYNVSVPPLVAQLEGILIEAFKVEGRVNGAIIKILLEKLLLKDNPSEFSFDEEIHQYYIHNILVGFEHGKTIGSDISRNAILHGADTEYGTQSISIKVILLFDYIISKLKDLDEEMLQSALLKIEDYRNGNKKVKR